jgi:hypothetical protein
MHIMGEALVPSPRGLLEAIEGLVKTTNMLRMSVIDEAGRLLAVDLLCNIPRFYQILWEFFFAYVD